VRPAALRALVASGLVEVVARERATVATQEAPPTTPPPLSAAQRAAVAAIVGALDAEGHASFLLHGVTGSGKTEVFLAAAQHALARGRGALLLVPEIALTHQLLDRVRGRLGNTVAVLHSGLGPRERWAEWRRIRSGEARAVVGARSALFAPVDRLGLVVVDEEHDAAYKQEDGFRYNARDLAVVRARLGKGVVVLASATPSAESYHAALDGRHRLLELPERPTPQPLPPVTLVDLRNRPRGAGPRLLTDELKSALESNLARGGQTLVFLNRRGYATYLQCPGLRQRARVPALQRHADVAPRRARRRVPPLPVSARRAVGMPVVRGPGARALRRRHRADRGDAPRLLSARERRPTRPRRRAPRRRAAAHPPRLARGRHGHPRRHADGREGP
jgi:primosomal protein N' (replication factor Y)